MRRGNLLEGIAAGFQNYMKTRQWGEGMKQSKLQQEQMAMTNRMREQQYGWAMSPKEKMRMDEESRMRTTDYRYGLQEKGAIAAGEREFEDKKRWYDYQIANPPPSASGAEPYKFKGAEPVYEYFNAIAQEAGLPNVSAETMGEIQGYIAQYGESGVALGKAAVERDALMYSKQNYGWLMELGQSSPERADAVKQAIFRAFVDGQPKDQVQQEVLNVIRQKAIEDKLLSPGHGGWGDILDPDVEKVLLQGAGFVAEKMPSSADYNWRGTRR